MKTQVEKVEKIGWTDRGSAAPDADRPSYNRICGRSFFFHASVMHRSEPVIRLPLCKDTAFRKKAKFSRKYAKNRTFSTEYKINVKLPPFEKEEASGTCRKKTDFLYKKPQKQKKRGITYLMNVEFNIDANQFHMKKRRLYRIFALVALSVCERRTQKSKNRCFDAFIRNKIPKTEKFLPAVFGTPQFFKRTCAGRRKTSVSGKFRRALIRRLLLETGKNRIA